MSTVTAMFSDGSSYPMKRVLTVDAVRPNRKWEIQDGGLLTTNILLSQLQDIISLKFQRLRQCFGIQLSNENDYTCSYIRYRHLDDTIMS